MIEDALKLRNQKAFILKVIHERNILTKQTIVKINYLLNNMNIQNVNLLL